MKVSTRHFFRRGFSLVEVLIAILILASIGSALMFSLLSTTRQAALVEAKLKEAVLAQMLLERLRERVHANPYFLATEASAIDDPKRWWGTVTLQDPPILDRTGSQIPVNPLMEHLFNGKISGLYNNDNAHALSGTAIAGAEEGRISKDAVDMLLRGYSDFAIYLDVVGDHPSDEPLFKHVSKAVQIKVFRLSEREEDVWEPSFVLSSRIVCPTESLGDAVFEEMEKAFHASAYKKLHEKISEIMENTLSSGVENADELAMKAHVYAVFSEVNAESWLIEGKAIELDPGPIDTERYECIDLWLEKFADIDDPACRRQLPFMCIKKAKIIFQTFTLIHPALDGILECHNAFMAEVMAFKNKLQIIQAKLDNFVKTGKWAIDLREEGKRKQQEGDDLLAQARVLRQAGNTLISSASSSSSSASSLLAQASAAEANGDTTAASSLRSSAQNATSAASTKRSAGEAKLSQAATIETQGQDLVNVGRAEEDDGTKKLLETEKAFAAFIKETSAILKTYRIQRDKAQRLQTFFQKGPLMAVIRRLNNYPNRFTEALLNANASLTNTIDNPDQSSPAEIRRSIQRWISVQKVQDLFEGRSVSEGDSRAKELAARIADTDRDTSEYLLASGLFHLDNQKLRYTFFVDEKVVFRTLAGGSNPYMRIFEDYASTSGVVATFIKTFDKLEKLVTEAGNLKNGEEFFDSAKNTKDGIGEVINGLGDGLKDLTDLTTPPPEGDQPADPPPDDAVEEPAPVLPQG